MLTTHATTKLELEGKIRQCNEGKWEFSFDESKKSGNVVLDIGVPKHLDSSLIDVDVHPNYVSVVIKSKVRPTYYANIQKNFPNIWALRSILFVSGPFTIPPFLYLCLCTCLSTCRFCG